MNEIKTFARILEVDDDEAERTYEMIIRTIDNADMVAIRRFKELEDRHQAFTAAAGEIASAGEIENDEARDAFNLVFDLKARIEKRIAELEHRKPRTN